MPLLRRNVPAQTLMIDLGRKLPVTYLLFTTRGRISRADYWHASLLLWSSFYVLYIALHQLIGVAATWLLYPLLFWSFYAISSKRLHDRGKSSLWLAIMLLPCVGPAWLIWQLLVRGGNRAANEFGPSPQSPIDYLQTDNGAPDPQTLGAKCIINDVSGLNPVVVGAVVRPTSVEQICNLVRTTSGAISVGGGRFSMGGQTASPDSLHLDLRGLNRILDFSVEKKWIRVQAGIR